VNKRVNINDVAAAAGVHRSTVSRALTGSGPVSPENRAKVLAAAKALNYHPDTLAGALKSKRKNTWGLLSFWAFGTNALDYYYNRCLGGLIDSANQNGCRVLLQNVVGQFDGNEEAARFLHDAQLAGVVVLAPRTDEAALAELKRLSIPAVLLAYTPKDPGLSFVDLDNVRGARLMGEHLTGKGHRRIAFINGHPGISANARDRRDGFLAALKLAGLEADPALMFEDRAFNPVAAASAALTMMELPEGRRPSAIFCATDIMARWVIDALRGRGLRVPEDVAVSGFDDNPDAALAEPGISTVRFPFFEAGRQAGELLRHLSAGDPGPLRQVLEPALVLRASA
jgi:DNA-binding LacI/PurR family transcriptional regulator